MILPLNKRVLKTGRFFRSDLVLCRWTSAYDRGHRWFEDRGDREPFKREVRIVSELCCSRFQSGVVRNRQTMRLKLFAKCLQSSGLVCMGQNKATQFCALLMREHRGWAESRVLPRENFGLASSVVGANLRFRSCPTATSGVVGRGVVGVGTGLECAPEAMRDNTRCSPRADSGFTGMTE